MNNLDALQMAMKTLNGSGLKLWLYLNKNQDGYRFELSRLGHKKGQLLQSSRRTHSKGLFSSRPLRK